MINDLICPVWAKELYKSLEWSITKTYLFEDKLTERVVIHSPLCVLGTETKSSSQEVCARFLSAFIAQETMSKVGWYFKGYWLKAFPQHLPPLSK